VKFTAFGRQSNIFFVERNRRFEKRLTPPTDQHILRSCDRAS